MASLEHLSGPALFPTPPAAAEPRPEPRPEPDHGVAPVAGAIVVALARVVVTVVAGLALVALAPSVVAGWWSGVVVSGSMAPALRVGDVVITRPLSEQPERGRIIVFREQPDSSRTLVHRISGFTEDGHFITKGDANDGPDSTPVAREAVIGAAVVRVPAVGLPVTWARQGDGRRLALSIGSLALLGLVASRRIGPPPLLRAEGRHANHPAPT
jgi:signal peptidase